MSVIEVNKDTFEKEVLKSDVPVLVDFNAGLLEAINNSGIRYI